MKDNKDFIEQIRVNLCPSKDVEVFFPQEIQENFDPKISQIYITLFQPGIKKIRWGSRRSTLEKTVNRVITKLKKHSRFNEFKVTDSKQCRILFEMVIEEKPCNIRNLTTLNFTENRFEAGITGIKYTYKNILRFFMPTDAITHSIMTVNQLLNFLSKQTGHAKLTNKISERVHLMRREPIEYKFIKSIAFVSFKSKTIPLFRGYPKEIEFNQEVIRKATLASSDWLIENMNGDGIFLYFYDGVKNTKVDLDHPNMKDPLYNNVLRHSGGSITLLRAYELSNKKKYLKAAELSFNYFNSLLRTHEVNGEYACYPFDNKKSKLGGAGIGLVSLMLHQILTKTNEHNKIIIGLVRHILSRIAGNGEMLGYYIHPKFNGGKPLEDIDNIPTKQRKELFSFYYPGEALLGLALFYRHFNEVSTDFKNEVKEKSQIALDFLIYDRPKLYADLFLSLPADAWLMQAIEEWAKIADFCKQSYYDFVFNDANQMIEHMYNEDNSSWHDYIGGFYYNYGDHVYHDGSRCEGLIAAYTLAQYLGEKEKSDYIMNAMLKSAKGLMFTRHTKESLYAHQYPEKSVNSFRFKLTRQWVRVDSVQHTACFYTRLLESEVLK